MIGPATNGATDLGRLDHGQPNTPAWLGFPRLGTVSGQAVTAHNMFPLFLPPFIKFGQKGRSLQKSSRAVSVNSCRSQYLTRYYTNNVLADSLCGEETGG